MRIPHKLIDKVLEQIKQDVAEGDVTCIEEMLVQFCKQDYPPAEILKGFLKDND